VRQLGGAVRASVGMMISGLRPLAHSNSIIIMKMKDTDDLYDGMAYMPKRHV
jgi:hypothetical protein